MPKKIYSDLDELPDSELQRLMIEAKVEEERKKDKKRRSYGPLFMDFLSIPQGILEMGFMAFSAGPFGAHILELAPIHFTLFPLIVGMMVLKFVRELYEFYQIKDPEERQKKFTGILILGFITTCAVVATAAVFAFTSGPLILLTPVIFGASLIVWPWFQPLQSLQSTQSAFTVEREN